MPKLLIPSFCLLAAFLVTHSSQARTKLVALPQRGDTVLQMDGVRPATFVQEERVLTLQKGVNKVDFSWKGVSLDEDSIRLQILSAPNAHTLLNISYPPNEDALIWEIGSANAAEVRVRISYLLRSIDQLNEYKAIANKEETSLELKNFAVLRNFSGESFSQPMISLAYGEGFAEKLANGETKKVLTSETANIPMQKELLWDARKQIWDPEMLDSNVGIPFYYVFSNDMVSGLGKSVLPYGKIRIFQEDGKGSTIFLGESNLYGGQLGEEVEVELGQSRDVVVTQRTMREERVNIRRNNTQTVRIQGNRPVQQNNIELYDKDMLITTSIENFKDEPVTIVLVQSIEGEWEMQAASHEYEKRDAHTLEFKLTLPPTSETEMRMQYTQLNIRPNGQFLVQR